MLAFEYMLLLNTISLKLDMTMKYKKITGWGLQQNAIPVYHAWPSYTKYVSCIHLPYILTYILAYNHDFKHQEFGQ